MKKYFLTFADKRFMPSLRRILRQAQSIQAFDGLIGYTEEDLSNVFRSKYAAYLSHKVRGFGYWCWKPEIIKMALDKINTGDALLYVDVGCHINPSGKIRLQEYFEILDASSKDLIVFRDSKPNALISPLKYDGRRLFEQYNYQWTKGDLFDYFGVRQAQEFTHSRAISAGIILIKKGQASSEIINEWSSVYEHSFSLADDSPSVSQNLEGFIEHRHDQSIFTIICIKYAVDTLSCYEFWYPSAQDCRTVADWNELKDFPIHAMRDKKLAFSVILKSYFEKCINKLLAKIKILLGAFHAIQ
jgi:hypothetical protein